MDIQLELICCFMVVVVERYTLCPLFELAWECRQLWCNQRVQFTFGIRVEAFVTQ